SAAAQVQSLVGPQSATAPVPASGTGMPGATLVAPSPAPPAPVAVPPVAPAAPSVPAGNVLLAVAARSGQNAPPISAGLIWRGYARACLGGRARPPRNFPLDQGGPRRRADVRAAAGQLRRAWGLGTCRCG